MNLDPARTKQFYIDGRWVDPDRPRSFEVINPATEDPCATISLGSDRDVDVAVAAACNAFVSFSQTPVAERLALLHAIRDEMERRIDDLGDAIRLEMGAPRDLARKAQATSGTYHLDGFIDALKAFEFEHEHGPGDVIVHEPIGVCGLITPWNWPINQIVLKVIPAIATGCSCVLKPSEIAPLSALVFGEILHDAGVPAGVFNLINGDGPVVGAAMASHPDIDMISLTGSARAGAEVTRAAAQTFKRVTLELGGKSPNIIFADANVRKAASDGTRACFRNTGQSCNAPTRMLVERSVYDQAVAAAEEEATRTTVGDTAHPGDHIGPLVSQAQFDKVQSLIQAGIDENARLVAGGLGRPEGFNKGYYMRPTVFAEVDNTMTIAREEIFGPVLCILPFDDEEEAISISNDTPYGLSAYLSTSNPERAERIARKLRAGMVQINGASHGRGSPFGGYKHSGIGREGGRWGLEDFLETKAIASPARANS